MNHQEILHQIHATIYNGLIVPATAVISNEDLADEDPIISIICYSQRPKEAILLRIKKSTIIEAFTTFDFFNPTRVEGISVTVSGDAYPQRTLLHPLQDNSLSVFASDIIVNPNPVPIPEDIQEKLNIREGDIVHFNGDASADEDDIIMEEDFSIISQQLIEEREQDEAETRQQEQRQQLVEQMALGRDVAPLNEIPPLEEVTPPEEVIPLEYPPEEDEINKEEKHIEDEPHPMDEDQYYPQSPNYEEMHHYQEEQAVVAEEKQVVFQEQHAFFSQQQEELVQQQHDVGYQQQKEVLQSPQQQIEVAASLRSSEEPQYPKNDEVVQSHKELVFEYDAKQHDEIIYQEQVLQQQSHNREDQEKVKMLELHQHKETRREEINFGVLIQQQREKKSHSYEEVIMPQDNGAHTEKKVLFERQPIILPPPPSPQQEPQQQQQKRKRHQAPSEGAVLRRSPRLAKKRKIRYFPEKRQRTRRII